jgi:murein DD-endopeptidase MepM/ murein hydrolase activator NlpD
VIVPARTGRRRRLAGAALLCLLAVALLAAAPAGEPPRLYLEVPGRVAVDGAFDVFVSSSAPVSYTLRYGDHVVEAVEQDVRTSFVGMAGQVVLEVAAVDGAGRRAQIRSAIVGLAPPRPTLEAPSRATVGDPLTVRLSWEGALPHGALPALVADAWIELDGRILDAHADGDGLVALTAVPLDAAAGAAQVRGVVVDEFGTWHRLLATVMVAPNPHPVQVLQIAPSVLAVSTPDGRELEARTLADAFGAVPPDPRWREAFSLPIVGRGTSGFGLPRRYGPGGNVSFHLGVDIAAPEGTPIHATNDGIVLVAGFYPIKGGLVVLDHGFGVTSLYFHQSRLAVEVGAEVARGDVIGYVGSTGLSTGPHLHWEMRVDGVPTDPLAWLDRRYPVPTAAR